MTPHWTSRVARTVRGIGRVFGSDQWPLSADDADARRTRTELDAIRARFPAPA